MQEAADLVARRALHVLVLLVLGMLTFPSASARAHSFVHKTFDQLVQEADKVFVGVVTGTQPSRLPNGAIVTDVTFSSLQVLKGNAGEGEVVLRVLGGTVDGETMELVGFPKFVPGTKYLVFLKDNGRVIFPVVGVDQGLFQILRDPATGEELVFDAHGNAITSESVIGAMGAALSPQDRSAPLSRVPLDVFVRAIQNWLPR